MKHDDEECSVRHPCKTIAIFLGGMLLGALVGFALLWTLIMISPEPPSMEINHNNYAERK